MQEMVDSNIITLYGNKGDRGECNNYRGISLLSVNGKVFARVLLSRLQIIAVSMCLLSSWPRNCGYDLLAKTAAREMSVAAETPPHCVCRPNKSFRLCQPQGSLPYSPESWMPSYPAQHDHCLPREHEKHYTI